MTIPLAYLNGRFLPVTEASLPLHDAGFVMGATVTDLCRTYHRVLFRWGEHRARFRSDCATCYIPLGPPDDELNAIASTLVEHNAALLDEGQELVLSSFATPGLIGYYLGEPGGAGDGPATLGMYTFPLPMRRYRRFFEEGVTLAVAGYQPNTPVELLPPSVKHRSRLHWWIADRKVKNTDRFPPHALTLLLNPFDERVTETAIGHFLLVKHGEILTPKAEWVLNGISLRVVEELCQELAVPFRRAWIEPDDLRDADEAMLCGTAFGVAGVSRIDNWQIPWPGPVFTRLLKAWSDLVGVDIARQFLPNP